MTHRTSSFGFTAGAALGLWLMGCSGASVTTEPVGPSGPAAARAFTHGSLTLNLHNNGAGVSGTASTADELALHSGGTSVFFDHGLWIGAHAGGETRVTAAPFNRSECQALRFPAGGRCLVYLLEPGSQAGDPDYDEWPRALGAPVTVAGAPRLLGVRTAWSAHDDRDPSLHAVFDSAPLGAEIRRTVWAQDTGVAGLGGVLFVRLEVKNASAEAWSEAFLGLWSDADLGEAHNDLVGCDIGRALGYSYTAPDSAARETGFGGGQPAAGVRLLKLPAGAAFHAFPRLFKGADEPANAAEAYSLLDGLLKDGTALLDSTSGEATRFWAWGDPRAGTGTVETRPGDRRMVLSVGPLPVEAGETVRLTYAILFLTEPDALDALDHLRSLSDAVAQHTELWDLP